jgi:hypothetical protein
MALKTNAAVFANASAMSAKIFAQANAAFA